MATVLHLPTIVDLAIKSPEDQINTTMLHSVLQVLIQQLDLGRIKVEFRGDDSKIVQTLLEHSREENRSHLEYKVLPGQSTDDAHGDGRTDENDEKKSHESEIVYVVESGHVVDTEKRKPQTISYASFSRLEGKVRVLQAQVEAIESQKLPNDEQLLEEARTHTEAKPITNLIANMNITKRLSGAEEGIDKLASLLETVAKEYADLKLLLDKVHEELGLDVLETMKEIKLAADYARKMRPRAELYEKILMKKGIITGDKSTRKIFIEQAGEESIEDEEEEEKDEQHKELLFKEVSGKSGASFAGPLFNRDIFDFVPDDGEDSDKINALIGHQELLRRNMEYITAQVNTLADFADKILPEILAGMPHMEELKRKIAAIRAKTGSDATITEEDLTERRKNLSMEDRVCDLEVRISSHASKLRRQDSLFCDKYDQVILTLRAMEEFNMVVRHRLRIDETDAVNDDDNYLDPETIRHMETRIDTIFADLNEIRFQLTDVSEAQDKTEEMFEKVYTEIESLQLAKADRFEMDDILADKADCKDVEKKVDHDIFEEFSNNLSRGIDAAIQNTEQQDKHTRKELAKMYKLVQTKFNTSEIPPLKEELIALIESLRTRIEEVAKMRAYTMAAGSKKRLYTEVNCISCDKHAAMDSSEDLTPLGNSVRPYVNVKPYITYELDQLRNMQIKNPGAKNLILHEEILKNYAKASGFNISPSDEVRFVNRYCGGSETVVNPQQKLARTGDVKEPNKDK